MSLPVFDTELLTNDTDLIINDWLDVNITECLNISVALHRVYRVFRSSCILA